MSKFLKNIKFTSLKLMALSFTILIVMLVTPFLISAKHIFSAGIYYGIIAYLIFLGLNFLVACVRVSDLKIPLRIKFMHFSGLLYNLPRAQFKSQLSEFIDKYGETDDEKNSLRSFLFYSTIHFYVLSFAYLIMVASIISLLLLAIPDQVAIKIPILIVIILVFVFGNYVLYQSIFTKSMFSNLIFTFRNIRRNDIELKKIPYEIKPIINEDLQNYSSLFYDQYKTHIPVFDKMLNDLEYANDVEWHGTKAHARLFYDAMVNLGVMKKISAEKASRCFSTRFVGIQHGTFKGREQNIEITEKMKAEIKFILSRLPSILSRR